MNRLLVTATLLAALLPSLSPATTLRWARSTDASTLDPHAVNNGPNLNLLQQIYEPLLIRGPDGSQLPTLATSWKLTADPSVWEFKLRQGVRFHDGTALSADDVVFSIKRAKAPSSDMKALLVSIADVIKVDAHTVHIKTTGPNPILPASLSNILIVSANWARANRVETPRNPADGEDSHATRHTNGTGPYQLVSREPDSRTVLKQFDRYWGKGSFPLEISELVYLPIKAPATRVVALLSGEVDFVQDVPISDIARLSEDARLRVTQAPENRVIFLGFNVGEGELKYADVKGRNPLADRRVREAFHLAIDREALKRIVMRGLSVPTGIIAPPFVHGYDKRLDVLPKPSVEQARALLAAAGYPEGFGITLHCTNDRYLNDEAICTAVAGFLGKIGVKVTVVARPLAIQTAALNSQDTDFYLYGWGVPTLDSAYIFDYLFHSRSASRGSANATRYANPALDQKIAALSTEGDVRKRDANIAEIWSTLQKEQIYLPLHNQILTYASTRRFDIPVNPTSSPFFKFYKVLK